MWADVAQICHIWVTTLQNDSLPHPRCGWVTITGSMTGTATYTTVVQ